MQNNTDPQQNAGNNQEPVVEKEPTTKTYTKEDLDNSFNAGVKKANSDWQKDEKYKEFLKWKETNQNDSDKINELQTSNTTLTNENKTLANENNLLKAQIKVNSSDVKKEFSEFVTSEVMKLVNDNTTFETALTNYKKDHPQFFGETVVKKVQSSPNLNGGDKPKSTNDVMNNILRSAKQN